MIGRVILLSSTCNRSRATISLYSCTLAQIKDWDGVPLMSIPYCNQAFGFQGVAIIKLHPSNTKVGQNIPRLQALKLPLCFDAIPTTLVLVGLKVSKVDFPLAGGPIQNVPYTSTSLTSISSAPFFHLRNFLIQTDTQPTLALHASLRDCAQYAP